MRTLRTPDIRSLVGKVARSTTGLGQAAAARMTDVAGTDTDLAESQMHQALTLGIPQVYRFRYTQRLKARDIGLDIVVIPGSAVKRLNCNRRLPSPPPLQR